MLFFFLVWAQWPAQRRTCRGLIFSVKSKKYNVKNVMYILYTIIFDVFVITYISLIGTIKGRLIVYHTIALCKEKKPNFPVAERGGERLNLINTKTKLSD